VEKEGEEKREKGGGGGEMGGEGGRVRKEKREGEGEGGGKGERGGEEKKEEKGGEKRVVAASTALGKKKGVGRGGPLGRISGLWIGTTFGRRPELGVYRNDRAQWCPSEVLLEQEKKKILARGIEPTKEQARVSIVKGEKGEGRRV